MLLLLTVAPERAVWCAGTVQLAGACMRCTQAGSFGWAQVGSKSTVLGFVGAPFTLASYIVEGGSSRNYTHIKRLAFGQPAVLHALLTKLADNVADYVRYQARALPNATETLIAACRPTRARRRCRSSTRGRRKHATPATSAQFCRQNTL